MPQACTISLPRLQVVVLDVALPVKQAFHALYEQVRGPGLWFLDQSLRRQHLCVAGCKCLFPAVSRGPPHAPHQSSFWSVIEVTGPGNQPVQGPLLL